MDDEDYSTVLRREFSGEEGSFLYRLHYRVWDRTAFSRLSTAMLACCLSFDEDDQRLTLFGSAYDRTQLPRWLTAGFWFVFDEVEYYASPNSTWAEKAADPDYYAQAYQRIHGLTYWFFTGESGILGPVRDLVPL